MKSSAEYLIVGSGASAVSACSQFIRAGVKPLVIDASGVEFRSENWETLPLNKWKSRRGGYDPYMQSIFSQIDYDKNFAARSSHSFGGFTRVWGATLDIDEERKCDLEVLEDVKNLLRWNNYQSKSARKSEELDDFICHFNSINSEFSARRSHLAINMSDYPKKCTNSLRCFDSCPNDAIWFAGDYIKNWSESGLIEFVPNLFVDYISRNNELEVNCIDFSGNRIKILSKSVFLACGPIGTAAVLVRSGVKDSYVIKDSHTIFSGFLSLRSMKDVIKQNALSKWWVSKHSDPKSLIQIHEPSDIHIERLKDRLPSGLKFSLLAKKLANFVHPAVLYFDPEISGSLIVQKSVLDASESDLSGLPRRIEVYGRFPKHCKRKIRRALVHIQRAFVKNGMYLPVFMTQMGSPGDGFHSGSFLIRGEDIDSACQLKSISNLYVIDSSSLESIRLGSITPSIMVHAGEIVKKLLLSEKLKRVSQ